MKRVSEKVKDIVEVCSFTHLNDFGADPGLTLAGYHFTDITADLMANWIDRVAAVKTGQGAALALAGFRGVGKSHFIAVLAAVISRPELRSRISDQHVASAADRLSRRHGPVAFVRRGSGTSLLDEVKRAISVILDVNPATLSDSLYDLLLRASEQAGEVPLALLIDTALERYTRVARDDGAVLSEIAEAAKTLGIFVGVALDDDISGADGPNSSISGNFSIDYLDQEHLYKIVDSHIFSKHSRMLPVLHEIYEYYREVLPGFRWSEQRFTALYPLHPATLEIAPLIRLYIQDFAMLKFAAEAGVKILGRPANSLIGLDEVFDSVENKLRGVPDLTDTFSAFDKLEREVVSKTPVQFRLPAKLILKGLLMLSLNGQGASASEIAASMMIFGENATGSPALDVDALLDSFSAALPQSVDKVQRETSAPKFCFRLTEDLDFDSILTEAGKGLSDEVILSTLLRQTAEKFSDLEATDDLGLHPTACSVHWRGAIRRGEIVWNLPVGEEQDHKNESDWSVRVAFRDNTVGHNSDKQVLPPLFWSLAELTTDEKDTIRRHHLLHNDPGVREQFADGLSTAAHVHSIAVEKIWRRVFLQDGLVTAGDREYRFSEEARSVHSLSQLFTAMLGPVFEAQYPSHPEFSELLGMKQASHLIANFFSGSGSNNAEPQKLAEVFAAPLGLAVKQGDAYVPCSSEALIELETIKSAFDLSESDPGKVIPLHDVSVRLRAAPVGLTREAQHLILGALIAQRQYEFVTSSGNRINHRSLDLQIIWDDIVGVARPLNELYAPERLLSWAKLITGNAGVKSLDRAEDRQLIADSLAGWLRGWKESRIIDGFDALPDENLNAGIWRTAANLRKSFGAMADTIDALDKNDVSLDQCLQLIADLFSDSETDFEKKKSDLRILKNFTAGVSKRAEIATYLSLSELTDDTSLERSRLALLDSMISSEFSSAGSGNDQVEAVWANFKDMYANYYAEKHDAVMISTSHGDKLREIIRSEAWSAFENFSTASWLDGRYFSKAKILIREIRQLSCQSKVRESLASRPYCSCSFSLSASNRLADLPNELENIVGRGLESFKTRIVENAKNLIASADSDAMTTSVKQILTGFDGEEFPPLTVQDARILRLAIERMSDGQIFAEASSDRFADEFSDALSGSWELETEPAEVYANT